MQTIQPEKFRENIKVSKCFHCPNSKEFNTFWEVLMHVFDGEHIKNVGNQTEIIRVESSDHEHNNRSWLHNVGTTDRIEN